MPKEEPILAQPKWCPKTTYSPIVAKIAYVVVFLGMFLILFLSSTVRGILTNQNVLFIPWAIVLVLNLLSYYQNPIRLTSAKKCDFPGVSGIRCDLQNAINATGASTFDCFTLFLLLSSITDNLTFKLILCFAIWGVCMLYIWTIYNSESIYEENNFKFLPNFMACKKVRVAIYFVIMVLDIIAFYQGYIGERHREGLVENMGTKFGGWGLTNNEHIAFIFGVVSATVATFLDFGALHTTLTYDPKDYDLPLHVQAVMRYKMEQREKKKSKSEDE